ncbi:hypothetical protein Tco_0627089 [Tanacetum coccineum]|uniref:Uncharacterized protein n=1 Tax=Tanacetum coccineum TaxID=301880 RepID=A0ABQ4WLI5_9ASTR
MDFLGRSGLFPSDDDSVQGVGSKENKYNPMGKEESLEADVYTGGDKEISADPLGLNDPIRIWEDMDFVQKANSEGRLKLQSRLSKWKAKTLSIGGRLTLLKSVLGASPLYNMSIFKVPKGVLKVMESIRSNFFKDATASTSAFAVDTATPSAVAPTWTPGRASFIFPYLHP